MVPYVLDVVSKAALTEESRIVDAREMKTETSLGGDGQSKSSVLSLILPLVHYPINTLTTIFHTHSNPQTFFSPFRLL